MKLAACLTTCLCLASASTAFANGYVGLGLGSDATVSGGLEEHFVTGEEASSGRLILGQRVGPLAIEASLYGTDLAGVSTFTGRQDYSTTTLGVDLKYHLGLFPGLEMYLKAGLNKTWLTAENEAANTEFKGRGNDLGLGLQYTFDLQATDLSIWLDYTHQNVDLANPARSRNLEGQLGHANLGLSIGF